MGSKNDVIIIGGGPGGYKTAELLGKKGLSIVLVEASAIGGTCLNMGCIPFKTYLHISGIYSDAALLGIKGILDPYQGKLHQERILEQKNNVVRGLRQGVETALHQSGVTLLYGKAEVIKAEDSCFTVRVNDTVLESTRLIIATGSEERCPVIPDDLPYRVITSKEMLELDVLPGEIDIIGAGAIGMEAASYFANAGSRVTLIEATDHIGGHIDGEIAKAATRILERKGIKILTETRLECFSQEGTIYRNRDGQIQRNPDIVLIAMGRTPKIGEDILRVINPKLEDGAIWIDDECRTSCENVYACGDVTGKLMLAHTAYRQAQVIVDSICDTPNKIDYRLIPRVIYANPEVLTIGDTEEDCIRNGIPYTVRSLPMTYSGKYFAENGKDGAKAKMVLDGEGRLIGLHVIGNGFSEFAIAAELMIANQMSVDDIHRLVFPHPSYAEIFQDLSLMC